MSTDPTVNTHAQARAGLSGISSALLAPFPDLEAALVDSSGHLVTAVERLTRLTRQFDALPQMLASAAVEEAMQHLAAVTSRARQMAETLTAERDALHSLVLTVEALGRRIDRLRATIKVITVLALNARVAATQVRVAGTDFTVFTAEIGRLAGHAAGIVDQLLLEHGALARVLADAERHQAHFEQQHKDDLLTVSDSLEQALSSVAAHQAQSALAATKISSRSRHSADSLAAIIGALQIGDITRQRIEHSAHALDGLGQEFSGAGGDLERWYAGLESGQRNAVAAAICRLQTAQLRQARNQFGQEISRSLAALAALQDDSDGIVTMGRELYGDNAHSQQGGSFLGALAEELRRASDLIRSTLQAREELDRLTTEMAAVLSRLTEKVEAVTWMEGDMHLVGLNTSLRCGRLGSEGRTLSIIAQELRASGAMTVTCAEAVREGIRDLIAGSQILQESEALQDARSVAVLEQETATAIAALEQVGAELDSAMRRLGEDGQDAVRCLEQARHLDGAAQAIGAALDRGIHQLERFARQWPIASAEAETVRQQVLEKIRGRYTMASEREIHQLFAEAGSAEPGSRGLTLPQTALPASSPAADDPDLDSILF